MFNRAIAAIIATALAALIAYAAADIPSNVEVSQFDLAAFATFAVVAVVKIIWPATLFAVKGDAE